VKLPKTNTLYPSATPIGVAFAGAKFAIRIAAQLSSWFRIVFASFITPSERKKNIPSDRRAYTATNIFNSLPRDKQLVGSFSQISG
jgi:hypothetical protein